jgi:hypothetical protein
VSFVRRMHARTRELWRSANSSSALSSWVGRASVYETLFTESDRSEFLRLFGCYT